MFRSLRSRLWLTYALFIGLIFVIAAALLLIIVRNIPIRNTNARLQALAGFVINQDQNSDLPAARIQNLVTQLAVRFDTRLILVNIDGNSFFDSASGSQPAIQKIQIPSAEEFNRQETPLGTARDQAGGAWQYAIVRLERNLFLAVLAPRPRVLGFNGFGDELLTLLLRASAVAVILALVISILISRWISRPLQGIAQAAGRVSEGDYQPITVGGPTEVQQLARAFNDMTARVEASQNSQRDFVANVSHELKTPLTSIQGFSQALVDGTVDGPAGVQAAAEVIYGEASRMHRLVIDLLELARLDGGAAALVRGPVDLNQILEAIVRKFTPQAEQARIELISTINPMPPLIGDGDRLAQVFTNLVDNALKHTPPEGQVEIRVGRIGDYAEVFVADSGPGIPEDERARIFERFYQLDKSRVRDAKRGVGLGLAIANEIVEAHGGHLFLESQTGKGSVFVVKIPIVQPDDSTLAKPRK